MSRLCITGKAVASLQNGIQFPILSTVVLVYVDDVQAHFENSGKLGARILSDLEFGEPGTRYRAEDLEGQRWMFMQKIKE